MHMWHPYYVLNSMNFQLTIYTIYIDLNIEEFNDEDYYSYVEGKIRSKYAIDQPAHAYLSARLKAVRRDWLTLGWI